MCSIKALWCLKLQVYARSLGYEIKLSAQDMRAKWPIANDPLTFTKKKGELTTIIYECVHEDKLVWQCCVSDGMQILKEPRSYHISLKEALDAGI
jgi:hypothetical protein